MAVDDTKSHEALLLYFNNGTKTWYLAGSTRGVKEVIQWGRTPQ